jgi:hypothetical protein
MFSGRKVRTKVVEDSYNAVFMQELHLNALLPSMSDKIVLRVSFGLDFFIKNHRLNAYHTYCRPWIATWA